MIPKNKKNKPSHCIFKYSILLLFLSLSLKLSAQYKYDSKHQFSDYLPQTVFIEYQYSTTHILQSGIEFCLNKSSENKFFIGAGYGMALQNNKLLGFPNAHISYNQEKRLMAKINVSNTNVAMMGGVTFLNVLDLGLGYSYPIQKNDPIQLNGFIIGLTARLSRNNAIYGKLKWF